MLRNFILNTYCFTANFIAAFKCAYDTRNDVVVPYIDTVEDQLTFAVNRTKFTEDHPTIDDPCGYCGTSQNPNDICRTCFNNL